MAISDTQKIDLLLKKVGYGVAKTDSLAVKSPSNESIASPLLLRGDLIWAKSGDIAIVSPAATTTNIEVHTGTAKVTAVNDTSSTTNRTWLTNLTDWIPVEFGSAYQVKVWAAAPGTANPSITGTRLFPDGSGNNDSWYFDYQSGVLNFADAIVPAAVAGKVIYIEGYRYIGIKGLDQVTNLGFVSHGTDPANWDQNTKFGLFYVSRGDWAGTTGTPTLANSVGLLTVLVSADMCVQKYQSVGTGFTIGSEYSRIYTTISGWLPWSKVLVDTDIIDGGTF